MPQITKEIPLDPVAKKTVLRLFTYGLYAVGVAAGEDRNMFTANWVTQVSFEPPLIAMSVQNDGHSIDLIRQSRSFAISVLGDDQRDIAGLLGKRWKLRPEKIEEVAYRLGMTGSPILEDALGSVECIVTDSMAAGDSTLFIGRVMAAEVGREGTPLTMAGAGFRHAG
ncbi:MAG TPA: flavin reductase family protein [Chloroflexota bacterium]|nr:flavin reductase family protein [Chloroflexota bacterium]